MRKIHSHCYVHAGIQRQKYRWLVSLFRNQKGNSDLVVDTQTCWHPALCGRIWAQVTMAGRSMNRICHKTAAATVGSRIQAAEVQLASEQRYQRRQTEDLFSLEPNAQVQLSVWHSIIFLHILLLASMGPLLWKFSISPYLHLIGSLPPCDSILC